MNLTNIANIFYYQENNYDYYYRYYYRYYYLYYYRYYCTIAYYDYNFEEIYIYYTSRSKSRSFL